MAEVPWHLVLDDIGRRAETLKRKKTNADLIRAMTDEELAEFLEMIPYCGSPPTYTTDGFCVDNGLKTKKQWIYWLRQEAQT